MFFRGPSALCLTVLLSLTLPVAAQVTCTPVYINEYQDPSKGALQPHALLALPDGTYLVAGRGAARFGTFYAGFISRHAADGTPLWTNFLSAAGDHDITGICPLSDGSFMLSGSGVMAGHPEGKGWLTHIDAAGNVLWTGMLGSAVTGRDVVKAVHAYSDGDIVGTINLNDSSAASDPVVFKMGVDGTLRWAHRFDNGNDDSYTTLAVSGDTIYAGGYYSSGGAKLAVMTLLQAETGTSLLSRNINNGDPTLSEELTGLEIGGGVISYGLYVSKPSPYSPTNGVMIIHTDLAGNTQSATYVQDPLGISPLKPRRSPDGGTLILRTNESGTTYSTFSKLNSYGYLDWSVSPGTNSNQYFQAFDVLPDGSSVCAGHYTVLYGGALFEAMNLTKITARGEMGGCSIFGGRAFPSVATYQSAPFQWASEPAFTPMTAGFTLAITDHPLTVMTTSCPGSVCLDQTPIPAGCSKTYNIQYTSARSSVLRDIMATPDGGRIAVGNLMSDVDVNAFAQVDGLVTKYQSNGDIAWSKNYDIPGHGLQLRRILRMADGNYLILGNDYSTQGNYALTGIGMLKIDGNGNELWYHLLSDGYTEVADAATTPDNGFVIALHNDYGTGSLDNGYVVRFDANANAVWRTQVTQPGFTSMYKAITCSSDAVFVAYDSYPSGAPEEFGVDRLDLTSGKMIYSRRHSVGSGAWTNVNNIFTVNDSVYVFLYYFSGTGGGQQTYNLLTGLDGQGNLFRSLQLGANPVSLNSNMYWGWLDACPPSVTMTADRDFWLVNRQTVGASPYLVVTRLKADGTIELSKLHAAAGAYQVYNVRPQGKGVIIAGSVPAPHSGSTWFSNAFVLKLDSSGQLQTGAAANCQAIDAPVAVSPCAACGDVFEFPKTAASPLYNPITTATPYQQDNDMRAVLLCYQPGNCNAVNLLQKGATCALKDTIVFYLDNSGNCGAAATWNFDPAIFQPAMITGDSVRLVVQKEGNTTVEAKIEGYCSFTDLTKPVTVSISALPTLGLPADTVICTEGPIQLQANPGFASYLWSDNSTNPTLKVAAPGLYTVTGTDACGREADASVHVRDANAGFHLTPDTIRCNNDVDTLRASPGYSQYQWSPTTGLVALSNLAAVSPATTTQYTVTALLSPGCTVKGNTTVTVQSSPAIDMGPPATICKGDSLRLDAGAGFVTYQWNTGAAVEVVFVRDTGRYWVAAVYGNGCISRDSFQLANLYDPRPVLDPNPIYCAGEPRPLSPGDFDSYLWSDGSTGASLTVSATGTYWVRVTDDHGCAATDTVNILTLAQPPVNFLPVDTSVCQYGGLQLKTRSGFTSYAWSDGSSGAGIVVALPGSYWVQVKDENGCTATDTVNVKATYCLVGLFVPNAFSPNGNGHNDLFRPIVQGPIKLVEFVVFDRWGQRVFDTRTPQAGWDGMVGGNAAPAGGYVWFCYYQPDGGAVRMEKGTVVLVR